MATYHFYEPGNGHGLRRDPLTAIIGPRPIGWISSRDGEGGLNLAPYSFFNMFNYKPPLIGFASNGPKDSATNIEATGEFVWNLATRTLAEQMNISSASVGPAVDEFALAGLTPAPSRLVAVPRVAESPVSFECRLTQIVRLRDLAGAETVSRFVVGQVVGIHIDTDLLDDGIYQTMRARPILRGGGTGDYFEISPDGFFHMERPA